MNWQCVVGLTFLLASSLTALDAADREPLREVRTISLPGVSGRFDHFACDPAEKRLVLAALGNDSAEVVDLAGFVPLKSLRGLKKPTGVLILSQTKQLVIANGSDGTLRTFNAESGEAVARIAELADADNIRFDP